MPQSELIIITGHLGAEPRDIVKDGQTVGISFTVYVSHGYKDKNSGQWVQTNTNKWNITAYGDAAIGIREYSLTKGSAVRVQGRNVFAKTYQAKDGTHGIDLSMRVWDGDVSQVVYKPKAPQQPTFADQYLPEQEFPADMGTGMGDVDIPF